MYIFCFYASSMTFTRHATFMLSYYFLSSPAIHLFSVDMLPVEVLI